MSHTHAEITIHTSFVLFIVNYDIFGQAVATVHRSVPIDSATRIKNIRHTIEFCTRAINSRGQNKGALVNSYVVRAMNYASIKEYKKAISDYTSIVSLNPKFADAFLYRGTSYDAIQNYQAAIKDYERCLTFVTNDLGATAFLYNTIATEQRKLKQYDKAVEYCSQAISLAPNFGGAYANRGELYGIVGKYQLAIDDFNTAMGGYRDNKIILSALVSERAEMKRYLKQYQNAVNDFLYAIQLNPDNKIAYWNMAASYNNNGDYQLADEAYSKAILYYKGDNKNLSKLYDDRALMEIGQQQYKKALNDDSLSISLDNQFAPAYWNKAIAYAQNADFQLSIDAYTKAIFFTKTINGH